MKKEDRKSDFMSTKTLHYMILLLLKLIKQIKRKNSKHLKVEIKIEYDSRM